jgi:hypothetical protein
MMSLLADRLRQQPRLVLLVDGIGAIASASFLGVILPALEGWIGMPRRVLLILALIALAYGAGSIAWYYLQHSQWRRWLRAIILLNLAYCGLTAALVVWFWSRLTVAGVAYFLIEIIVIGALVALERHVLADDARGIRVRNRRQFN